MVKGRGGMTRECRERDDKRMLDLRSVEVQCRRRGGIADGRRMWTGNGIQGVDGGCEGGVGWCMKWKESGGREN